MIDTDYLNRCIASLIKAYELLMQQDKGEVLYDVYRSAVVKEFELILEQSGKLLKKAMQPHFADNQELDRLFFKDIFRYGHKFGLLNAEQTTRWFEYRESRNQTAHNYGEKLAQKTLTLVPQFIIDSQSLVKNIEALNVT